MELRISDIVESLNGRDEGGLFFIVSMKEEYAFLADGRRRRIEKPKLKKIKHLRYAGRSENRAAEKLRSGEKVTNNELRRALAEYAAAQSGGMEVC